MRMDQLAKRAKITCPMAGSIAGHLMKNDSGNLLHCLSPSPQKYCITIVTMRENQIHIEECNVQ